jgi:hypothetical protein
VINQVGEEYHQAVTETYLESKEVLRPGEEIQRGSRWRRVR